MPLPVPHQGRATSAAARNCAKTVRVCYLVIICLSKLCKFCEDIYNGILKFEKSFAVINDRAENASISLDLIKAESISKLECLELSIENKSKDIEKSINEISESLHADIDINRENGTSNNLMYRNNNDNYGINNILIYGDSNTKHIDLSNSYTECTRIATYRISDIDVNRCSGFKTIWINCGINDLKHRNCKHDKDIHVVFKLLLSKLDRIRAINPGVRVILSPILPTGINALTERAAYFNSLMFAVKNPWWSELNFSSFLSSYGNLDIFYRCRNNPSDRIHLGYNGVNALTRKIKFAIARTDTRTYASIVRGPPYRHNASS